MNNTGGRRGIEVEFGVASIRASGLDAAWPILGAAIEVSASKLLNLNYFLAPPPGISTSFGTFSVPMLQDPWKNAPSSIRKTGV
jgi:hypothetical protein